MTHNSCNMSVRRKNIRNADLEMNPWTCMRPGLLKCPSCCVFHRITSGIQVQSTRSHRRQLTVHDGMTFYCPNENCVPQDFPFVDCCILGSYWHVTSCDEIFWLRSAHSHLNWREVIQAVKKYHFLLHSHLHLMCITNTMMFGQQPLSFDYYIYWMLIRAMWG